MGWHQLPALGRSKRLSICPLPEYIDVDLDDLDDLALLKSIVFIAKSNMVKPSVTLNLLTHLIVLTETRSDIFDRMF